MVVLFVVLAGIRPGSHTLTLDSMVIGLNECLLIITMKTGPQSDLMSQDGQQLQPHLLHVIWLTNENA